MDTLYVFSGENIKEVAPARNHKSTISERTCVCLVLIQAHSSGEPNFPGAHFRDHIFWAGFAAGFSRGDTCSPFVYLPQILGIFQLEKL